jgi:regulator of sigma E protease
MSPFFVKAVQLLLSLSILIILHELGHFIPARLFKTRVEKFFLFFDVKFALFKKKIGDTVYGIGWLPLGGYVKISGMIDESMDTEQMEGPPKPWEFRSKPAWQRLIIMLGGVTVNLLLGFLIYMMVLFVWGKTTLSNEDLPKGLTPSPIAETVGFKNGDQIVSVDGQTLENVLNINRHLLLRNVKEVVVRGSKGQTRTVQIPENFGDQMFQSGENFPLSPAVPSLVDSVIPNSPAALAGIKANDEIVALNDTPINNWTAFRKALEAQNKGSFSLVIMRNKYRDTLSMQADNEGKIGVYVQNPNIQLKTRTLSFSESIVEGFGHTYWTLYDYVAQFKYIFTKKGASQLGGFGTIGNLFPSAWDWRGFWSSTALISIILAFMNVLPIPALDGGHVMFLLYEMLTGRKPNDKFMEYAQMTGFFLLMALVLYANGNDLIRAIFG